MILFSKTIETRPWEMNLSRNEAGEKLNEWTKTESLRKHARAVELVMEKAAHKYGSRRQRSRGTGIAGMLHDADYEKWHLKSTLPSL